MHLFNEKLKEVKEGKIEDYSTESHMVMFNKRSLRGPDRVSLDKQTTNTIYARKLIGEEVSCIVKPGRNGRPIATEVQIEAEGHPLPERRELCETRTGTVKHITRYSFTIHDRKYGRLAAHFPQTRRG